MILFWSTVHFGEQNLQMFHNIFKIGIFSTQSAINVEMLHKIWEVCAHFTQNLQHHHRVLCAKSVQNLQILHILHKINNTCCTFCKESATSAYFARKICKMFQKMQNSAKFAHVALLCDSLNNSSKFLCYKIKFVKKYI